MGRILIAGEDGHDIVQELYPVNGEIVIDKPGKGAFYNTNLGDLLQQKGIANLLVTRCHSRSVSPTPLCARPMTAATAASCSTSLLRVVFPIHEMGLRRDQGRGGIRLGFQL